MVGAELSDLWLKLSLPKINERSITKKVEILIKKYHSVQKSKQCFEEKWDYLFDITKVNGNWLRNEDKEFYILQVKTDGQAGYCTSKIVKVHPSKAGKKRTIIAETGTVEVSNDNKGDNEQDDEQDSDYNPRGQNTKRKYENTTVAVNLVKKSKLSIKRSAEVCKNLSECGVNVQAPSNSGVNRATMSEAQKMEKHMINHLKNDDWVLHFDGKRISGIEYQVLILKNAEKEVKLAILKLGDGKANSIYSGIAEVLDKFQLWSSIKVIISDTTSVNTGSKNGVVSQLQREFERKNLEPVQLIGCQHHVLDTILKHSMNEILDEGKSSSPEIYYKFIVNLQKNYENLKSNFKQGEKICKVKTNKWRDDMDFLFELVQSYRYMKVNGSYPAIKFKSLPSLNNARWNSKAIYALLAYILNESNNNQLHMVCDFITSAWSDI